MPKEEPENLVGERTLRVFGFFATLILVVAEDVCDAIERVIRRLEGGDDSS